MDLRGVSPDRNAFREAEKKYQLHFEQIFRKRSGKARSCGFQRKSSCLEGVVDVENSDTWSNKVVNFGDGILGLLDKPGLFILLNAIPIDLQRALVKDSISSFIQPPAVTNHTQKFGEIHDLWLASRRGLYYKAALHHDCIKGCWTEEGNDHSARELLQKLRWSSLGPVYDWTARKYLYEKPQLQLPAYLIKIVSCCFESIRKLSSYLSQPHCISTPSEGNEKQSWLEAVSSDLLADRHKTCFRQIHQQNQFSPDAALLNYYSAGETLGGHKDDVEADMSKPIVSISLGCSAIFLMGGQTKEEPPVPILLRSGNVLVMAGEARGAYHGIPRILDDETVSLPFAFNQSRLEPQQIQENKDLNDYMKGRRVSVSVRATK